MRDMGDGVARTLIGATGKLIGFQVVLQGSTDEVFQSTS